jgi:hypothetical protein
MSAKLERRDFIKVIAGSIAAWRLVAHAHVVETEGDLF